MKRVLGCLRRADEKYDMIRGDDRICVGVSGGKDMSAVIKRNLI